MFRTPTPFKTSKDGSQGSTPKGIGRGGKSGTGKGEASRGGGGPEGKDPRSFKKFEKRVDYQNPDAFSIAEVSMCACECVCLIFAEQCLYCNFWRKKNVEKFFQYVKCF